MFRTNTLTAYRAGNLYYFERPRHLPSYVPVEPVRLRLSSGVYLDRSDGELLVYSPRHTYGVYLNTAISSGLLVVEEDEEEEEGDELEVSSSSRLYEMA
jgi:hypothetical protein